MQVKKALSWEWRHDLAPPPIAGADVLVRDQQSIQLVSLPTEPREPDSAPAARPGIVAAHVARQVMQPAARPSSDHGRQRSKPSASCGERVGAVDPTLGGHVPAPARTHPFHDRLLQGTPCPGKPTLQDGVRAVPRRSRSGRSGQGGARHDASDAGRRRPGHVSNSEYGAAGHAAEHTGVGRRCGVAAAGVQLAAFWSRKLRSCASDAVSASASSSSVYISHGMPSASRTQNLSALA